MIKYISIFRLVLRCLLVARKENLTGFSTGLTGRSKNRPDRQPDRQPDRPVNPTGAGWPDRFPFLVEGIDYTRKRKHISSVCFQLKIWTDFLNVVWSLRCLTLYASGILRVLPVSATIPAIPCPSLIRISFLMTTLSSNVDSWKMQLLIYFGLFLSLQYWISTVLLSIL